MVMQEGRKIIPCIWALKVKDEIDGTKRFKARLVSCGYMQVPGVDYTEKFSPVATDTSLRVLVGMTLYHDDWICVSYDVEAAFLMPKMDTKIVDIYNVLRRWWNWAC